MTDTPVALPSAHHLIWPTVLALRELGGSGTNSEIDDKVIELEGLTEEQQSVPHSRNKTKLSYRLAWARSIAKMHGLLENSARAVWSLIGEGWTADEARWKGIKEARRAAYREGLQTRKQADTATAGDDPADDAADSPQADDWKSQLLDVLRAMEPDAFERLAKRLLREAGFINVTVTGKTNDGGIDGTGVYRMSLVSFPVFFQCKRYSGTVSAGQVRDFRGAMIGRGDKGLLITTGTFTVNARAESTRDGAPPLDLIDGDELAELLKDNRIGVDVRERVVEDVIVDPKFFTRV